MLLAEIFTELLNHPLASVLALACGLIFCKVIPQARQPLPPGPPATLVIFRENTHGSHTETGQQNTVRIRLDVWYNLVSDMPL